MPVFSRGEGAGRGSLWGGVGSGGKGGGGGCV